MPAGTVVNGAGVWARFFGDTPVINMGFGWDRTQNVLWRLRQGEFEGLNPQWIVLNIGTNNLTATSNSRSNTPAEIAAGIDAICAELHGRSPESHIVLMGIFPRGAQPSNAFRAPIQKTNQLLAEHYTGDSVVTFLDIGNLFLANDGTLPKEIMPDGTHPSEAGYQIWAHALMKAGLMLP
jgi:lysophospholipase L1-like esterase